MQELQVVKLLLHLYCTPENFACQVFGNMNFRPPHEKYKTIIQNRIKACHKMKIRNMPGPGFPNFLFVKRWKIKIYKILNNHITLEDINISL